MSVLSKTDPSLSTSLFTQTPEAMSQQTSLSLQGKWCAVEVVLDFSQD